jgi:hypothetical protein
VQSDRSRDGGGVVKVDRFRIWGLGCEGETAGPDVLAHVRSFLSFARGASNQVNHSNLGAA